MEEKKNLEAKKKKVAKPKKELVKKQKKIKKVATDLSGNEVKRISDEKIKKKHSIKGHFKKYKKMYTRILLFVLLIFMIIFSYLGIRSYLLNKKYGKYEKQVELYGFSLMYNNGSPKSSEKLTRLEMVKIVLASIYNTTDVESIGFGPSGEFDGDEWAKTAKAFGIIDDEYITKETYNEGVTYKEALVTYLNARSKLKDIPLSSTTESSFKNLQSYSQEERQYINDAVENGLLENSNKKLNINNTIFKGQFNELIVKFVEKYNTVAPEGETLVTNEESKPSNYEMYPYILYSVPKEVYEYRGISEGEGDYATPAETYKYDKDYYPQMQYRTEAYYNTILNIDYRTLNKDEFLENADRYLRFTYTDEINEYIEYVKNNKIIIEGTAKVQLPIFYLDGICFRARVKLTFEIKNSETDKNLLLGDTTRAKEVTYKNKKYTVYIDAPMGTTLLSKALLLDMTSVIDVMVSDTNARTLNEF